MYLLDYAQMPKEENYKSQEDRQREDTNRKPYLVKLWIGKHNTFEQRVKTTLALISNITKDIYSKNQSSNCKLCVSLWR